MIGRWLVVVGGSQRRTRTATNSCPAVRMETFGARRGGVQIRPRSQGRYSRTSRPGCDLLGLDEADRRQCGRRGERSAGGSGRPGATGAGRSGRCTWRAGWRVGLLVCSLRRGEWKRERGCSGHSDMRPWRWPPEFLGPWAGAPPLVGQNPEQVALGGPGPRLQHGARGRNRELNAAAGLLQKPDLQATSGRDETAVFMRMSFGAVGRDGRDWLWGKPSNLA